MGVVIVSGGMDSVTLLHAVVKSRNGPVTALSFDYGQRHRRELDCAREQAHRLGCRHELFDLSPLAAALGGSAVTDAAREIPSIGEALGDPQPTTYVPNRNMLFLSIAAALAESTGSDTVYYGAQKHDLYGYWDTTEAFVARLNAVLGLNRKSPVQVQAPLIGLSKAGVLRRALELGVDLAVTWSCYAGGERPCGTCPTCAERAGAFRDVGCEDPLTASAAAA